MSEDSGSNPSFSAEAQRTEGTCPKSPQVSGWVRATTQSPDTGFSHHDHCELFLTISYRCKVNGQSIIQTWVLLEGKEVLIMQEQ